MKKGKVIQANIELNNKHSQNAFSSSQGQMQKFVACTLLFTLVFV